MNDLDITKLLRVCRTVWPDIAAGEDTITAWTWALGDLPYPVAQNALQTWMRTSPFAPKPADLRKIIAEDAVGGIIWDAAWDELVSTARMYSHYLNQPNFNTGKPPFVGWSSPEVEAAVNHIGYGNYCMCETSNLGTMRAQFRDFYNGNRDREIRAYQTGAIPLPAAIAQSESTLVALNGNAR